MSSSEISDAILRKIRICEAGRVKLLDLAVHIERLGMELKRIDAHRGNDLKQLAVRLSTSEFTPDVERPKSVLYEVRLLAAGLG
jgi:hypothetical protein